MTLAQVAALGGSGSEHGSPASRASGRSAPVLDTVGNALAAHVSWPRRADRDARRGAAGRRSGAIGGRAPRPAPAAALVNGTLAHALDFDDTHLPSILHPSASIVPAALAVAEAAGRRRTRRSPRSPRATRSASGSAWPATTPAAATRVLRARPARDLDLRRARAAAARREAARPRRARASRTRSAIAGEHGRRAARGEPHGRLGQAAPLRLGRARRRLRRRELAAAGPDRAADGARGPLRLLPGLCGGRRRPRRHRTGSASAGRCPTIFFKPYPANHFTHRRSTRRSRCAARASTRTTIERSSSASPAPTLRTIGEPREEKIRPRSGYHAQFSGPFTVAAALLGGGGLGVYLDDFTDERAQTRSCSSSPRASAASQTRSATGYSSTFSRPPARPSALGRRARMLRAVESRRPRAAAVRR